MAKLIFDNFGDIYAFTNAIKTRKDNGKASRSSHTGGEDFAGMPFEDAAKAVTDGLPDAANKLKRELTRFQAKAAQTIPQRRPINYYNGHSPNVPAAIIGLPKAMRKTVKTPSKVKTLTLFYNSSANCNITAEQLENSGSAVLQLTYWLELNGYRVRFMLTPYLAEESGEKAVCNILLKDFRQPLDILKLSFSITSVSMFRRLGFRWLETVPGLEKNWSCGYGRQIREKHKAVDLLGKTGQDTTSGYFVMVDDCIAVNFDPVKLADRLGIKVG